MTCKYGTFATYHIDACLGLPSADADEGRALACSHSNSRALQLPLLGPKQPNPDCSLEHMQPSLAGTPNNYFTPDSHV